MSEIWLLLLLARIVGYRLQHVYGVRTSTISCACTFRTYGVILQHTPVSLPLVLLAGQDHPYSLFLERFPFSFTVSRLLERLTLCDLNLSWAGVLGLDHSHDLVSELLEQSALGWLCHIVSDHVPRGAPFHSQLLLVNAIRYEIVTNIDVLRALAARSFAILSIRIALLLS